MINDVRLCCLALIQATLLHVCRGAQPYSNQRSSSSWFHVQPHRCRWLWPPEPSWANKPQHMGLSENSVPLKPMVLLIIIPIKWLFHWEYTLFSDKPIFRSKQAPWHGKNSLGTRSFPLRDIKEARFLWASNLKGLLDKAFCFQQPRWCFRLL